MTHRIILLAGVAALAAPVSALRAQIAQDAPNGSMPTNAGSADAAPSPLMSPSAPADLEAGQSGGRASSNTTSEVGDIVVTARRRAESIQQVPVAVTALSANDLEQLSVRDLTGLSRATPGLFLETNPRSGLGANVTLRGQATQNAVITYDSPIGLYVDDVFLARNQGVLGGLFDVSQVQVLRGVQGSLFGRNSNGGAILISTQEPLNDFSGYGKAALGNYAFRQFEGVVNAPVVDGLLAIRGGLQKVDRKGFEFNRTTGERNNSRDTFAARFAAKLTPGDDFTSILRYDYLYANQLPPATHPNKALGPFTPPQDFYESITGAPWEDRLRSHTVSLTSIFTQGDIEIRNILSYHRQRGFTISDSDGFPLPLIDTQLTENQDQYTGELRVSGKLADGRLRWLVGGYYFHESGDSNNFNPATLRLELGQGRNKSIAGFAHLEFDITDRLGIGGGVRRTRDDRRLISGRTEAGVCRTEPAILLPGQCLAQANRRFNYWTYDANINYRIGDAINLYARTGRGVKAGGFDVPILVPASLQPYQPEIARDYEVGLKAEFLDRRLRTNFAAFRTDYDDIQRIDIVLVAGSLAAVTRNAAKARIQGFEAEVTAVPVDGLTLSGSLSVTDADYKRFTLFGTDVSNNEFTQVPKTTYTLAATHALPLGNAGDLTLHADYSYKSRIHFATVNNLANSQRGYGLLSARATFAPAAVEGLEIAAFATNITGKKYNVGGVALGPFDVLYRGMPFMIGGEVTFRFGQSGTR